MKLRDGLRIHETPTQPMQIPFLQPNAKHPAGLTCGDCGAMFNTGFARSAHWNSRHNETSVYGLANMELAEWEVLQGGVS